MRKCPGVSAFKSVGSSDIAVKGRELTGASTWHRIVLSSLKVGVVSQIIQLIFLR